MTLNDLELPKYGGLVDFFTISGLQRTFQEWIAPKWLKIDQDNLCMKFSPLNVNFSSPSFDPLRLGGLRTRVSKRDTP